MASHGMFCLPIYHLKANRGYLKMASGLSRRALGRAVGMGSTGRLYVAMKSYSTQ